jgi:protein-tyrosine phosphatase
MRFLPIVLLVVVAVVAGCGTYSAAPRRLSVVRPGSAADAFKVLSSRRGPTRFAQVTPTLYRGGEPSDEQLALLSQLGVRTIIDLRNRPLEVAAEEASARKLGIRALNFPFSGLSEPDPAVLEAAVAAIQTAQPGAVYVHCKQGRDRTSLIVALYRVWLQGWKPSVAWRSEALDFGHGGVRAIFFRKLDRVFARLAATTPAAPHLI